jgi:peptidoglycan/xylan/chitin deacetylase (PgdA/CDA1 family)
MSRSELAIDIATGSGIMFHHFHGDSHPVGQGSISADEVADLIEFVGRKKILDASEWQERAVNGRLLRGDICLSFDDALSCQLDIAMPVLDAYEIKAFWFVYTSPFEGFVQRLEVYRYYRDVSFGDIDAFYASFDQYIQQSSFWLDVKQALRDFNPRYYLSEFPFYSDNDRRFRFIRDKVLGPERYFIIMDAMVIDAGYDTNDLTSRLFLKEEDVNQMYREGHSIGLHSHTHPTNLAGLSASEQLYEYRENIKYLKQVTDGTINCMSHPCNSYNSDTLAILNDLGVDVGFRSNMFPVDNPGKLEYPREDHANLMKEMTR